MLCPTGGFGHVSKTASFQWCCEDGEARSRRPRCFSLGIGNEKLDFVSEEEGVPLMSSRSLGGLQAEKVSILEMAKYFL